MAIANLTDIFLSAEKRFLYEAEAAYRGQSLGVYLRERLEKSESSPQERSCGRTPKSVRSELSYFPKVLF